MREVRFDVEGESVAAKLHEPTAGTRGQVVLVHGLLSQAAEFGELGEKLASRGWRVLALDQRGFGASGGERGIITEERATADVLAGVEHLRKVQPNAPVALVGHSMGAVFTLGAMARDPSIKTAILGAPMRTVRSELKAAEFQMYKVGNALSRAKSAVGFGPLLVPYKYDYDRLFHDKAAAQRARERAFLVRQVNLKNYDSFVAMDSVRTARGVRQPVLVVLADYDRAVAKASSMAVHDALAGPKELAHIACGHSMWTDCEAERAFQLVDDWLSRKLA